MLGHFAVGAGGHFAAITCMILNCSLPAVHDMIFSLTVGRNPVNDDIRPVASLPPVG